ncbi:MAG: 1-acyl-sn-glycerol-3-phosphate acyltransferase [Treponema sp.]|jgi:1-acyl-sn-glycerol-3-phosphate acyltransferase|nr:1-acyl-sn-glycerol-3-phosphate acyltransferase [Treponema sp.]
MVFSVLGLKKPMSWIIYKIAQMWARILILVTGCAMDVKGRENIPAKGGVCFVSNHVGIFDIILALAYAGRPFGFIAKKELLYLPFFNIWIYMLGGLFIDRVSIRKAKKTIDQGIEKLQKGWSMLIFPEGTRSKGQGLLPFRSGAIKLATNSFAPIVPIAIAGSYEVFEKDYRVHGVPVKMVFCPVINTSELSGEERRHSLPDQVRSVIEAALSS